MTYKGFQIMPGCTLRGRAKQIAANGDFDSILFVSPDCIQRSCINPSNFLIATQKEVSVTLGQKDTLAPRHEFW